MPLNELKTENYLLMVYCHYLSEDIEIMIEEGEEDSQKKMNSGAISGRLDHVYAGKFLNHMRNRKRRIHQDCARQINIKHYLAQCAQEFEFGTNILHHILVTLNCMLMEIN